MASTQKEESTIWAVERSNAAASIDDLKEPIEPRAADDESLPNLPPPIEPMREGMIQSRLVFENREEPAPSHPSCTRK